MQRLHAEDTLRTAIVAFNDLAAIGVVQALETRGLTVPSNVSVVGYDDSHMAAIEHIALTNVRQDPMGIGSTSLESLLEGIDQGRTVPRHVVLEPGSTICAAGEPRRPPSHAHLGLQARHQLRPWAASSGHSARRWAGAATPSASSSVVVAFTVLVARAVVIG